VASMHLVEFVDGCGGVAHVLCDSCSVRWRRREVSASKGLDGEAHTSRVQSGSLLVEGCARPGTDQCTGASWTGR
jgi:hypothetical protein